MDLETLKSYINNTRNIDFITDLNPADKIANDFFLGCQLHVQKQLIPILLFVPKCYPLNLPRFCLSKFDSLGFLPHILPNGNICYLEKESVYINSEKPKTVFQASVEMVIKTLEDGLNGVNHNDFREEFNLFWNNNKFLSKLLVSSFIDVGKEPKKIQLLKNNNKKAIAFDCDKDIDRQKRIYFGDRKTGYPSKPGHPRHTEIYGAKRNKPRKKVGTGAQYPSITSTIVSITNTLFQSDRF